MKRCPKCGTEKPPEEFSVKSSWCKACKRKCENARYAANPEPQKAHSKRWREANPERAKENCRRWVRENPLRVHATHLKKIFGITLDDYSKLESNQKGVCFICQGKCATGRKLAVDHVKGTEPPKIRGLLCAACNLGLGKFAHSMKRLLRAICYLANPPASRKYE